MAGRLDADSEGLLLLTSDGQLQARISDPRFKMLKTYWVQVEGEPDDSAMAALRGGVQLNDGPTRPANAERMDAPPGLWDSEPPVRVRKAIPTSWIALGLREGRNRQVRRMTGAVGHPTLRLIRSSIGPYALDGMAQGIGRETEEQAEPAEAFRCFGLMAPMPAPNLSPHFSPAADRNKQAILEVLLKVLPDHGNALEIASGTGQHVAWFAAGLPQWTWQPTDAVPASLGSISAWVAEQGLPNVRPAMVLDVMAPEWLPGNARFDLVYCANMLHISPWATCAALMQGSARHLAAGGVLVTYGPYLEDGVATSEGNLNFDRSLRAQDLAWGIRRREEVEQEAARAGLRLLARHAMPANNLLLVWGKA